MKHKFVVVFNSSINLSAYLHREIKKLIVSKGAENVSVQREEVKQN